MYDDVAHLSKISRLNWEQDRWDVYAGYIWRGEGGATPTVGKKYFKSRYKRRSDIYSLTVCRAGWISPLLV